MSDKYDQYTKYVVSEDIARKVLWGYAKEKTSYSTKPAVQMKLRTFRPLSVFNYRLYTLTETRTCEWKTVMHNGLRVDGPENGPALGLWDVKATPPKGYETEECYKIVPHTSSLKICLCCSGQGRLPCRGCIGKGKRPCQYCGGSGCFFGGPCWPCFQLGQAICFACRGSGHMLCLVCGSKGKLLQYLQIKIKWKSQDFAFLSENSSDFPTERFHNRSGKIIFHKEQEMVTPISNFPKESINEASKKAIIQHRPNSKNTKIVRQRHSIEWLPLTRVKYTWNDKGYDYYVYGEENKVYAKDYPKEDA
ncbi:protein SSUH2 homolog [Phyllobates terribilis]|uniref:protein SSUH2 homolog n=1 Tax=Phyllobates terribilis TaxID=111132 RepID=UPI003CCAF2EC